MQKAQKCVINAKLKFEDYKYCLKVTELKNKINQLEKKDLEAKNIMDSLKKSTRLH